LAAENGQSEIASAINDISERTTLLVREEIELAKAEISQKVSSLVKGIVVGLAAGVFVVIGLLFLLHGAAWAFYDFVFSDVSYGYFIVAGILFLLGALAGFLAARAFKKSTPPMPRLAIDEARLIKETFTSPGAGAEAERHGATSATRPN
jgi:hypothetical protein